MKPIKLSLEGVFSYQEKQTIDFEKLSRGGIFGIFGNTGSGKSSIIEAMLFALFSRSDRISGRQVDLVNLRKDKAIIEFEFESFGKQYLSEVIIRRTKAKHETKRSLYVMEEGNYRSVGEDTKIEDVIGLSYENFCRIVIIPQGRFQAFFSLTEGERTQMLKEIFPLLSRYDLRKPLDTLSSRTKEELNTLSGRLSQLEEYTEEGLEKCRERLAAINARYELTNTQNEVLKKAVEEAQKLLQLFENKEKTARELEELNQKEETISALALRLKEYERAKDRFATPLASYSVCSDAIRLLRQQSKENSLQLEVLIKNLKALEEQYAALLKENALTPQQQQEISQLKAVKELQDIERQISSLTSTIQNEHSRKQKGQTLIEEQQKARQDLEKRIADLERSRPNAVEFAAVKNWFWEKELSDQNIGRLASEIAALDNQIAEVRHREGILEVEDPVLEMEKRRKAVQTLISQKENERSKLQISQALCRYSASLSENEPCPLCGSLSHPRIAKSETADEDLARVNAEIETLKQRENSLNSLFVRLESLFAQRKSKTESLKSLKEEAQRLQVKFVWENYRNKTSEDIRQMELCEAQTQKHLSELHAEQNALAETLGKYQRAVEQIAEGINRSANELSKYSGQAEQLTKTISEDIKSKYSSFTPQALDAEIEQRNAVLEKRNAELVRQSAVLEKQNAERVSLQTKAAHYEEELTKREGELADLERVLSEGLQECGFEDLERVKQILAQRLDTAALHRQIEEFKARKQVLESGYAQLCRQIEGKERPRSETILQDKETISQNELLIKQILEEKGSVETSAKTIAERLEQKCGLEKQMQGLQKRLQGLNELYGMFKGEKFVQFISSIYLEQLCSKANERLRLITRSNFVLRYENRNFEVEDLLNGGKTRSIKTLSGGQMFQASLCMALALVDTIRLNANTNQDFFFIDEGFGTQDTESLELIFSSLVALHREDKTVGLISHNELLKEKIACNLSVKLDSERGSLIKMS